MTLARFLLSALFTSSIFFSFIHAASKEECKEILSKSARGRLNLYFRCNLCERSKNFRPDSKNRTEISIFMRAESLNFDDARSNLEFIGEFFVMWFDRNLTWNTSLYNDVKSLPVYTHSIWSPDLAILSAGDDNIHEHGLGSSPCLVGFTGQVICSNVVQRKIKCATDFKFWPYDRQKCTLIMTSWAHSSERINFKIRDETLFMNEFRSNGEWNYSLSGISYRERKSNYYDNANSSEIAVDFVVDRLHTHLRGRFIAPAIIMMVLTLTTPLLDPKSIERLAITCSNIIIHIMCIKNLHQVLPHNGTTIPNLLLFYVHSFVFATVALFLTILLGRLKDTKIPIPKWIASSTTWLFRRKALPYLQLETLDPKATTEIETDVVDTGDLMSSEPNKIGWTSVVVVCDSISFLCFLFAYIVLYSVLIPSSAGKNPIPALHEYDRVDDQFGIEE